MDPIKTDNSDLDAKLLVRRAALEAAGPEAMVLDCYAGEGTMYRLAWASAADYLGIDQRFSRAKGSPDGQCLRGDNDILLGRAMARAPWNLVDLDAYGNPWPLLRRVLRLAQPDRLVTTITDGIDRAIRAGTSDFAAAIAGMSFRYTGLLTRWYGDVIRWAVAWACSGSPYRVHAARVIRGRVNPRMRYWFMEFKLSPSNGASSKITLAER